MLNFLKKEKQINSQTVVVLKYKINLSGKEIEQTQFLTENYVYTESMNKKILYLPEKNKQYFVDTENKQLKELDLSVQMMQMNQIKVMIGEISFKERIENEIKNISIQNNTESPANLDVNMQIAEYSELENTVFLKFNEFQQSTQMFKVQLKPNEIIKKSVSVFSYNGQEQKASLELIEIKSKHESIEDIDAYCNFKIVK
jgi:hypothetical protein